MSLWYVHFRTFHLWFPFTEVFVSCKEQVLETFFQRNDYVGSPKQAIPVDAFNQIKQANSSLQEKRSCWSEYKSSHAFDSTYVSQQIAL